MSLQQTTSCAHCRLPVGSGGVHKKIDGRPLHFCCYGCSFVYQVVGQEGEEGQAAWWLIRLGLGFFLAMNVLLLSVLLYWSDFSATDTAFVPYARYGLFLLATPVILLLGFPFFRAAVRGMRTAAVGMDALIAVGAFSAYGVSAYATFVRPGHVYYDTATMIIVLVTLGKYLEASAKARTSAAVQGLLDLEPAEARVIRDGVERTVPISEVRRGDRVRALPGQKVAVDGVVIEGTASIDESAITGESIPVGRKEGDRVIAGTLVIEGSILVRTEATGDQTLLAHIVDLVESARLQKGPVQRLVDRIASLFVPAVIATAFAAVAFAFLRGDAAHAWLNGLSVLVVACPCALGLATPLAISVALGRAAREGVFIRTAEAVETLHKLDVVTFDKTGTVTTGEIHLAGVHVRQNGSLDAEKLLAVVAAVEARSEHPLARAVVRDTEGKQTPSVDVIEFHNIPGKGVQARVDLEGYGTTDVVIGNRQFLANQGISIPSEPQEGEETYVFCAWDGELRGWLTFSDQPKPDAAEALHACRESGLRTILLSGDRRGAVEKLAASLGFDEAKAELSPEDKIQCIQELQRRGHGVAMVGDGINDAPALARADVGLAMSSGTDLAKESADVSVFGARLVRIPWVIRFGRITYRKIQQNLFWAFFYNLVGIGLAFWGLLQPIFAASAMVVSSLIVVTNSLRLNRA